MASVPEEPELIEGLELHHDVIDAKLQNDCIKKIDLWLAGGRRKDTSMAELVNKFYL